MADIRFVKPPNDNRVRQFPTSGLHRDVLHISTPGHADLLKMNTPGADKILHITTPKRKSCSTPPWDIFITSKAEPCDQPKSPPNLPTKESIRNDGNNNAEKVFHTTDSSESRQSLKKRLPLSPVGSQNDNTKKCRDLKQSSSISSDETMNGPVFKKLDNNGNFPESIPEPKEKHSGPLESATDKKAQLVGGIGAEKHIKATSASLKESTDRTGMNGPSKCPIIRFYEAYGDSQENSLCDVSDEEIDQLPEVPTPAGSHSPPTLRKTSVLQPQHQQDPESSTQQQHTEARCKQNQNQTKDASVKQPVQPQPMAKSKPAQQSCRPCQPQYKFLEDTKPIRRSVSDAALADNEGVPSFFKTLKYADYNFDDDDTLDIDDMSFNLEMGKHALQTNHFRRSHTKTKNAWECSRTSDTSSSSGSEHSRSKGQERKSRLSSTPVELINANDKVKLPRSLSRDFTSLDRLRSRRCALADPERMIISQELREKLQKDVEKRKGSMVRKVSQFFNIQLGLNREEDLI